MEQWEYLTKRSWELEGSELAPQLTKFGLEGWELIHITEIAGSLGNGWVPSYLFWFKRRTRRET